MRLFFHPVMRRPCRAVCPAHGFIAYVHEFICGMTRLHHFPFGQIASHVYRVVCGFLAATNRLLGID
jgi:hypothetical protein